MGKKSVAQVLTFLYLAASLISLPSSQCYQAPLPPPRLPPQLPPKHVPAKPPPNRPLPVTPVTNPSPPPPNVPKPSPPPATLPPPYSPKPSPPSVPKLPPPSVPTPAPPRLPEPPSHIPKQPPPVPSLQPPYVPKQPPPLPSLPPPYVPKPPPKEQGSCPIDALKLNGCVDLLGGLVNIGLGGGGAVKEACCPVLEGLADLDAAICLCTVIKANLLNILIPIELQVLADCGKTPASDFQCPS